MKSIEVMFEIFGREIDDVITWTMLAPITPQQARKLRHRRAYYRMMARRTGKG